MKCGRLGGRPRGWDILGVGIRRTQRRGMGAFGWVGRPQGRGRGWSRPCDVGVLPFGFGGGPRAGTGRRRTLRRGGLRRPARGPYGAGCSDMGTRPSRAGSPSDRANHTAGCRTVTLTPATESPSRTEGTAPPHSRWAAPSSTAGTCPQRRWQRRPQCSRPR